MKMEVIIVHVPLKVLYVATEVTPYSKTGGLGDVAGSLPKALRLHGVDVRVVLPKYGIIKEEMLTGLQKIASFMVHLSWRSQDADIYSVDEDGACVYLIGNKFYFDREAYYGYGDDFERFAFFSKAAIEMLSHIAFKADIIHFNDWQTGLGCTYLRDSFRSLSFYKQMKSLFTIHNLHYQGVFGREILWSVGLNDGYFTNGSLEFYGNISYLKAGVMHANAVSTVSQTYAAEIQTPPFGFGIDGLLRKRGLEDNRLFGIVNGIDTETNNPKTDPRVFINYDVNEYHLKQENKHRLQSFLGLPEGNMPMIGVVSRLVEQKGFDIISVVMDELLHHDIQLVVLGTGEGRYENLFNTHAWRCPHKVSANIAFDDTLAQRIYAASDIFLMPSVYEPCGLTQLLAMRYGSVPVVRKTGGLADTVHHFEPSTGQGNGFVFEDYVASGLMWALNQALSLYGTNNWKILTQNAMSCDFSWNRSASAYLDLYQRLVSGF